MEIIVSQAQGRVPVTILQVKGNLDAATYEKFEASAKQAIQAGARDMLIDLAGVEYMSSAGLRALTNLFNSLHSEAEQQVIRKGMAAGTAKSPHLKLASVSPRVVQVLKMAGFDMYLEIHKNQKDALAAF